MYPGHQEDAERLMYVVINGILVACIAPFLDSSSIIPIMLLAVLFIVNLYIFAVNVMVEDRNWYWLVMSGIVAFFFFWLILAGLRARVG